MYGNVLVPVDGSTFSEHAIPHAGGIARRASARLHVVLVHAPVARHSAEIAPMPLLDDWEEHYRQKEARYLDELVRRLREQGVNAVAERLEGEVADRLVRRASSDADLIVMTTHGRAGLDRAWLGSVAEEVVHHVRLPVLLMKPAAAEAQSLDPRFEHILVATDGSEAAAGATDQAMQIARLFEARVTLLRVVSMPAGLSSPYIPHAARMDRETTDRRREEARSFLDELTARLGGTAPMDARVELAYHPARGILDAVEELGCDLVALGTHRRPRLARIVLGSVADKVVRASPVPVLVGHTAA
ncbi:MAG: universal stress protein [Gemmatimonadota bacterium]|nr:MAG: universal stress protein [Gemmatimonadota bacterium]